LDFGSKAWFESAPLVAYVSGFLGKQNLGDEALQQAAPLIFDQVRFLHYDSSRTLRILLRKFPRIKCGVLAGGTLINRIPAWWETASEFQAMSQRLYILGTGVAHPSFWNGRKGYVNQMAQWKNLLEKCSFVGVRGPLSAEVLREAGLSAVEVVGDPVLTFADNEVTRDYVPNSIGLNIGQAGGGFLWGDQDEILRQFIRLAKIAREAKWRVRWLVVWPPDLDLTRKAAQESGTADDIVENYTEPRRYLDEVRPLSVFVGMKLHATILATCTYVPSIMLEYQPKCRDYMQSIGEEAHNIRTDQFKADTVWELAKALNAKRNSFALKLHENVHGLRQFQQAKAQGIMEEMLRLG
jgi:polysaccharide pyruvyl transferase WcaK-like protein